MRDLRNKVVVITGAASGIGAALARRFGVVGAHVAMLDVDETGVTAGAAALRVGGVRVSTHVADVRRADDLERALDEVLEFHGHVDVLVNNAGVTAFGPFMALDPVAFQRVVDINFGGVVLGCRTFLPALQARPRAHVVNLASEAGLAGMPCQTAYCATKFAVRGFTAALRAELAAEGVGVTCVLPGATSTNILAGIESTDPQTTEQLSGLLHRRAPSADRVAKTIVRGVRRNRAEVFPGFDSWLLDWGVRFAPGLVRGAMRAAAREARRRARSTGS